MIVVSVLAGLIAMVPPDKKLKLGIDLSGGTILVYEVSQENRPENFNMDELISALKQRADPQGVKETPIRKIGSNRIEIILPQASDEEVEEVKKMLTDVGSLEFRILANRKHDAAVVDRALGPGGMKAPPRVQVGPSGRDLDRHQPRRSPPTPSPTRSRSGRRTSTPGPTSS